MDHMKAVRKLCSIVLSGMLAFLCLSVFTFFYYNLPVQSKSETLSTNFVWEKNKWQSRGTEGFASGKTDEKGFNNISVVEEVGILIMGSSQMEAFNVNPDENTTYVLNELLKENRADLQAYNIGISGHDLIDCINNLPNAVSEFQPSHYIVIETMAHKFDAEKMQAVIEGTWSRSDSHSGGIMNVLKRFSYLRLLYKQFDGYLESQHKVVLSEEKEKVEVSNEEYERTLDQLLRKAVNDIPEACQLIILLDKPLKLDQTNKFIEYKDNYYHAALVNACEENGIIFVDMQESFVQFYNATKQFPNGFSNTRVGEGHLNRHGHRLIASELLDIILQGESRR